MAMASMMNSKGMTIEPELDQIGFGLAGGDGNSVCDRIPEYGFWLGFDKAELGNL